jgi:hypothetical protein
MSLAAKPKAQRRRSFQPGIFCTHAAADAVLHNIFLFDLGKGQAKLFIITTSAAEWFHAGNNDILHCDNAEI